MSSKAVYLMDLNRSGRSAREWRECHSSPLAAARLLLHGSECRHTASVRTGRSRTICIHRGHRGHRGDVHVDFLLDEGRIDCQDDYDDYEEHYNKVGAFATVVGCCAPPTAVACSRCVVDSPNDENDDSEEEDTTPLFRLDLEEQGEGGDCAACNNRSTLNEKERRHYDECQAAVPSLSAVIGQHFVILSGSPHETTREFEGRSVRGKSPCAVGLCPDNLGHQIACQ